jgi:nucleotidyltransferase substrate binding protein (TIGR01987 family)
MIIDTTSFKQAISRLDEALQRYEQEPQDLFVQDSVVKRFEYTYALAYKILGRFLEATADTTEDISLMTFQELVRLGNEKGLLKGGTKDWLEYREKRNITSHTYDNDKSNEVIAIVPKFYEESKFLLERITEKNV